MVRVGKRHLGATAAALPKMPDTPEDGLLPAALFRAIYVSNSRGYVVLE